MAKKPRRRSRGDRRLHLANDAPGPSPEAQDPPDEATQHLTLEVRSRLRNDDPLDLLAYVSTLVVAAERPALGVEHSTDEIDLRLLVETFVAVDIAETTALLSVLSHLTRDDDLRVMARRALMTRRQPMPLWLRDLDETEVTDAMVMTEAAGGGFDLVLGIRWPGGRLATFLIYVDTLHGVVVKDAFPTPEAFADIVGQLRDLSAGVDTVRFEPIDLGEARAVVEGAVDRGEAMTDPFESDTWPHGRPMLRWLLERMPMPEPGAHADGLAARLFGPATDPNQTASLLKGFLGSPPAAAIGFDGERHCDAGCLGLLVGYAAGVGETDLGGWSPDRIGVFFGEWLPSRFLFDAGAALRLPEVARAFVRWSMTAEGRSAHDTRQSLAAVDREGADFVRVATSREAVDLRAALLAYEEVSGLVRVSDLEIIEDNPHSDDRWDYSEFMLSSCADQVGGREALLALDDAPLPDEEFDWADVPGDIRSRVEPVLALTDDFATTRFGVEFRTATRRILALAAASDPEIFRRPGRADTAAAAVCWVVAKANGRLGGRGGIAANELAEHFGVKGSPSNRAQVFLSALGASNFSYSASLGRPELLTGSMRASLIRRRELALADAD